MAHIRNDQIAFPRSHDITKEPSAETFLGFIDKYGERAGKFIRIGSVVLVAPQVALAPYGERKASHLDMIWAAFQNPDEALALKVSEAAEQADLTKAIRENGALIDAGRYSTVVLEAGKIASVGIAGDSFDFGRADDEGRQETVAIVQACMGSSIPVRSMD